MTLARQVPHTPEVQENGTSRPAAEAQSRMLGFSEFNLALQTIADDGHARHLGVARLGLVHHGIDGLAAACGLRHAKALDVDAVLGHTGGL